MLLERANLKLKYPYQVYMAPIIVISMTLLMQKGFLSKLLKLVNKINQN